MLQDIAGERINIPINITGAGDSVILTGVPNKAIYIYEIIGDLNTPANLQVKSGATVLHTFGLADSQGLTVSAIANLEGTPRFVIKPNEDFILNLSAAATFVGGLHYAIRE